MGIFKQVVGIFDPVKPFEPFWGILEQLLGIYEQVVGIFGPVKPFEPLWGIFEQVVGIFEQVAGIFGPVKTFPDSHFETVDSFTDTVDRSN